MEESVTEPVFANPPSLEWMYTEILSHEKKWQRVNPNWHKSIITATSIQRGDFSD
jgi:hypothetical protein